MTPINADLTTELLHRAVTLTEAGAIDEDVYCLGCGYNLRTLAASGTCPECGAEIAGTLEFGNVARFDPEWAASLRQGGLIFGRFPPVALLWVCMGFIVFSRFVRGDWPLVVIFSGVSICALHSAWRITASPARSLIPPRAQFFRRLARGSLIASMVSVTVGGMLWICFQPLPWIWTLQLLMTLSPLGVVGSVIAFSLASYCRFMAALLKHDAAVLKSTTYRRWFVRSFLCSAVGWLLTLFGFIRVGGVLVFVGLAGECGFILLILSLSLWIGSLVIGDFGDLKERPDSGSPTEVADAEL